MKSYQMYVCEVCGRESDVKAEIEECEANHTGHTLAEKKEYDMLKSKVKYRAHVVAWTANETTRREYDRAIEDLMRFESEHGIKGS